MAEDIATIFKTFEADNNKTPEPIKYLIEKILPKTNIEIVDETYHKTKDNLAYYEATKKINGQDLTIIISKEEENSSKYSLDINTNKNSLDEAENIFRQLERYENKTTDAKKEEKFTSIGFEDIESLARFQRDFKKSIKRYEHKVTGNSFETPLTDPLHKNHPVIDGKIVIKDKRKGSKDTVYINFKQHIINDMIVGNPTYIIELHYIKDSKVLEKFRKAAIKTIYNLQNIQDTKSTPQSDPYQIPQKDWSDLAGLEKIKEELDSKFVRPLSNPDLYKKFNIKNTQTLLLHGPPGTGKTSIAHAIAKDLGAKIYPLKVSSIQSKWIGEPEKRLADIYKKAKETKGRIVLFFDEIDGLVGSRENYNISTHDSRFIAQFNAELTELNNSDNNNIIIIGATNMDLNNPAIIDKAAVNRFKTRIPIDSPNEKQRTAIFKHYLKDDMTDSTNINYKDLISKTKNLSGRDIENICNDAGINAIQRFAKENNIDERYIKPDQFNKIKIKDCDIKIEKDNKKKKEKDLTYLG